MSTFVIVRLVYQVLCFVVEPNAMNALALMIAYSEFMAELCKCLDIPFKNGSE